MKLISTKALREFSANHPDAREPLRAFRKLIETGHFETFAALRQTFPAVDKVGDQYVFNIGGNKYRLIAAIAFKPQLFWVKHILTHAEYDKGGWR